MRYVACGLALLAVCACAGAEDLASYEIIPQERWHNPGAKPPEPTLRFSALKVDRKLEVLKICHVQFAVVNGDAKWMSRCLPFTGGKSLASPKDVKYAVPFREFNHPPDSGNTDWPLWGIDTRNGNVIFCRGTLDCMIVDEK